MPQRRKKLGQHHLYQPEVLTPAIDFLRPRGQRVVEIGPGAGILTKALAEAGATVLALELDWPWCAFLRTSWLRPEGVESVCVTQGDALRFEWSRLRGGDRVAGNLPYNISTALIERWSQKAPEGCRAAFLVQREVAERLAAKPGGKEYGSLSVLVQVRCTVALLSRVAPGSFQPPPKVWSAFVGLERRDPETSIDASSFATMVRSAFSSRRKTIGNCLGRAWGKEKAQRALHRAQIEPSRRAETVSPGEFLRLQEASRGS